MFSFSINAIFQSFIIVILLLFLFLNLFLEFHREWNFKEFQMFSSNILIATDSKSKINHFNLFKDYSNFFFFFFKPRNENDRGNLTARWKQWNFNFAANSIRPCTTHFSQFILSITLLQRFCADINEKLCGKLIIRLDLTAAAYFSWQRQSLAAVNIRVV